MLKFVYLSNLEYVVQLLNILAQSVTKDIETDELLEI